MTDKPVIHASLIDARNVGQDKEIKLELRIPAEAATHFLEIFGWPTRAAPVSVAIVPLKAVTDVVMDATIDDDDADPDAVSEDEFKRNEPEAPIERTAFTKLPRMKQAGIRCREPGFWGYLNARFAEIENYPFGNVRDAKGAAEVVRWWCMVDSRRELDKKEGAASRLWDNLEAEYWATQHGMK